MNIWRVVYIHIFVSDNLVSSNNCFQSSSSCSNYSSSIISIFFILWISSILSLPLRDLYLQEYSILFHVYRSCFNLRSSLSLSFLSLIYLFLKHSICTYECRSFNVYKILSFSFYVFFLLLLITILTIIIIIVVLFQSISKKNTTTTAAASTVVMVVVFVPIVTIILLWIV